MKLITNSLNGEYLSLLTTGPVRYLGRPVSGEEEVDVGGIPRRLRATQEARNENAQLRWLTAGLVVLFLFCVAGCDKKMVDTNEAPSSSAEFLPSKPDGRAPPVDLGGPFVELNGWRTLRWGDSPAETLQKLAAERIATCHLGNAGPRIQKGVPVSVYFCRATTSARGTSGLREVILVFLSKRLGRVSARFAGMSPDDAAVSNLSKALSERYCPLATDLGEAVRETLATKVDRTVYFTCVVEGRVRGGNVGISVEAEKGGALVGVFLSSDAFQRWQDESEFKNAF